MYKTKVKTKHKIALKGGKVKTYIFKVELEEEEEEGVWQAIVPILPGCNAWGNSPQEALTAIQENTRAYLETLIEENRPIPIEAKQIKLPINEAAIAVSI